MSEYIQKEIPGAKAQFVDNKGHLLFFDVWEDMLRNAVECADREEGKENQ